MQLAIPAISNAFLEISTVCSEVKTRPDRGSENEILHVTTALCGRWESTYIIKWILSLRLDGDGAFSSAGSTSLCLLPELGSLRPLHPCQSAQQLLSRSKSLYLIFESYNTGWVTKGLLWWEMHRKTASLWPSGTPFGSSTHAYRKNKDMDHETYKKITQDR